MSATTEEITNAGRRFKICDFEKDAGRIWHVNSATAMTDQKH